MSIRFRRGATVRSLPTVALTALMLSACVTPDPPLYRWGDYEALIYAGYKNPGSSDPVNDAILLEQDLARTESEGAEIPPGVRIHLAYLYFEQGREGEAQQLLLTERERFPESAVFVDRLLASMESRQ